MAYTTVTDECPFIRFSGNTLEDVVVEKSKVKLELVGTTINVVFISGGAQIISWNEAQALEYGYTPTSLYSYILGILKVQCGGGGIDSVQAGTNITVDNTDPENPIVTASFTQQGKYLISGGVSWSGTGLVYDVSTLEYFFNGNKTSTATQVTLGASDPSNNRFDVVVVNEAGVVSVIQGTASASPEMPPIPETELMVSAILVEAGSVAPTILSEAIYLDDPTTNWTFSTYTTGSPTGTIIFNGTTTPKQGIHCIEANADQRLGARFIRSTSFDAYQYSMFSVWVRFTSAVAPNNALNVRFENSGGSLVGNTVNLFNFGLQRNIINTWQLVVIPLTSLGSLPATVKGIRMIMTGGTVGVPRQWDVDYMQLTNGSIPYANVPTIAFQKDGVGVGSASTLNIKEGANMTITPSVNPISGAVEYEFEATSSGGGGMVTLTKAQLDTAISGNTLVAGALYEITGVHPTLYNDGTTSGTTIYLRAISGNQLEVQGMGKFYNPKYNQSVGGFGIWDNKMYGKFSGIVGQFNYINKEGVTANNGATGLMLADEMIQFVSGDWSTATSITGDVSSATANIADFVSPSYGIGDKVIWGGYSWTNVNGNVGASVDVLNLNAEWTKNVYDTTNYNIAYDVIEYDYANDMIIRRFEKESNVDVKCSKAQYDFFVVYGFTYHSISVQQFGNVFNTSSPIPFFRYKGQLNILCDNGYNESVNFSGQSQVNLTFCSGAFQRNLTFGSGARQGILTFGSNAFQDNLTFCSNASQQYLTFGSGAYQRNLTFGSNASQQNLTFGSYASQENLTFGSGANQQNLTFGSGAYQRNLTFGSNAFQDNLTFGSNASQQNLTFGSGAYQRNLTFGSNASQQNLTFGSGARQQSLNFAENTQLNFNNQTINSNIEYIHFRTKYVTVPNLSAATYIYDGNIKEVYQRPDNALKIRYYDNSDALVIVDIDD